MATFTTADGQSLDVPDDLLARSAERRAFLDAPPPVPDSQRAPEQPKVAVPAHLLDRVEAAKQRQAAAAGPEFECPTCGYMNANPTGACFECGHVEDDKMVEEPDVAAEVSVAVFARGDDMEPLHVICDALASWLVLLTTPGGNLRPWLDYESAFDRHGKLSQPSRHEYLAALDAAAAGVRRMIEMGVELPAVASTD